MKLPYFRLFLGFIWFGSLISPGCGNGDQIILTISPAGPVTLLRDNTLQFSASRSDVTWSVLGGNSNGTISSTGLYTPPTTIPVDSPQITIKADSSDGQSDTALVDLLAADNLTFGSPQQINDSPSAGGFLEALIIGAADWISVRDGSIQIDATWMGVNGTISNIFYSQNLDLLGFSPEENLRPDLTVTYIPGSIVTDSQFNPGIFYYLESPSQIFFLKSDNQGQDFNDPIPIVDPLPVTVAQRSVFGRLDSQDGLHVVYTEMDNSVATNPTNVFYSQSMDGGATWSLPKQISQAMDNTNPQLLPFLAVGPTGMEAHVCWQEGDPLSSPRIMFSFSNDGGSSFSTPEPITNAGGFNFCRLARGPNGEVYLGYAELDTMANTANIWLEKSTDGGDNFGDPVQVNAAQIQAPFTLAMISVDSLGRIDAAWGSDSDGSGDLDLLRYARSLNGGADFSPDVTIASGVNGNGTSTGSFLVPSGMKHDSVGRLYLQFLQTDQAAMTFNVNFLLGQ